MVRGIKGRDKPVGASFFKSWQAFEDEINQIWSNARLYNEDGSGIFELATEFELWTPPPGVISLILTSIKAYFNHRLDEAKKAVPEPPQPKVKLRMSAKSPEPAPKIKLRFGQKAAPDETSGIAVDNDALKRQQNLVKAGANGQETTTANGSSSRTPSRNPLGDSTSGSTSTPILTLNQNSQDRRSGSAGSPPAANGVKNEGSTGQSPALAAVQLRQGSNASNEVTQSPHVVAISMPPPPSVTPRLPSGSPHPQAATPSHHATNNQSLSNPLDSRWRQPGKGIRSNIFSTMPLANISRCF